MGVALGTLALLVGGCSESLGATLNRAQPSARPSQTRHAAIPGMVAIYVKTAPRTAPSDGRPLRVRLLIVNDLGHAFAVPDACNGWLVAGLTAGSQRFEWLNGAVACPSHVVRTGATTVARTVATTYQECSPDPAAAVAVGDPPCVGPQRDRLPPLPPGNYHLALDTTSIPEAVLPRPVTVTLTRP